MQTDTHTPFIHHYSYTEYVSESDFEAINSGVTNFILRTSCSYEVGKFIEVFKGDTKESVVGKITGIITSEQFSGFLEGSCAVSIDWLYLPLKSKETILNDVAVIMKSVRHQENLTGVQLAEKIGIASSYIRNIESGRQAPSLKKLIDFALALGRELKIALVKRQYK